MFVIGTSLELGGDVQGSYPGPVVVSICVKSVWICSREIPVVLFCIASCARIY